MSRRRQASAEVQRQVARRAREGFTPSQIHRELFPAGSASADFVALKTVQRMVRDFAPADPSGPWSVADADPEEARMILDVIAMQVSGRRWPTRGLAGWIARVRTAAPDIPPEWALSLAYGYRALRAHDKDTRYLDMVLVLRPWASENDLEWLPSMSFSVPGRS